jgi:signal transduction histidine kinase
MSMTTLKVGIRWLLRRLRSTTTRLTLPYLAVIIAMSLGFSALFYRTFMPDSNRQLSPDAPAIVVRESRHYYEYVRNRLLTRLALLNGGTLVGGAFLSYYLARRTLRPIERAMDAQSRFTSDASHELRTPLAAIQAENEVALRGSNLTLSRAKELLRSNVEEITRLQQLSEGLLRLTNSRQQLDVQPVWVDEIGGDAMNHVIKLAQAKGIAIEDTVPHVQVVANPQSLAQAIVILLDNAIKYSPEKSTIHLEGKMNGKQVQLHVRDEGIGIAASHLPHIFDRFYRADQSRTSQSVQGYGLGLSIAKKLIEQQHGSISAVGELGEGSTFTIRLPRP